MNKLFLPCVGILIVILMYRLLPYDGEFALLIFIALLWSIIAGIILGIIVDNISLKRRKYIAFALSVIILILLNYWAFLLNKQLVLPIKCQVNRQRR